MDALDVLRELRNACAAAGSQQAWAQRHGVSATFVSDVLNARREPSEAILRPLGFARRVTYVKTRRVNG